MARLKHTPVEDIVGFLSYCPNHNDRLDAIEKFKLRQWTHVLRWLDDSGLAFYFLQKLKRENASRVVPPVLLSRLERNFASNQARTGEMARRFDSINRRFTDAGVRYTAIKGFSLVPHFCPDASLRYQADLDYLVDDESLPAAHRVLVETGYSSKASHSGTEWIFIVPAGQPSRGDEQYSPQAAHAIELHTEIWDSHLHRLPPLPNLFSVAQARTHQWNGFTFPGQADEDAFLLQVLHACHHFFTQWIRLSCLFEIGYFLHRRTSDAELWRGIEQRVGNSAVLREFVVIVTEMTARLFAAPVPALVQSWGTRIRPGPRIWIEHYARNWALGGLPVYEFNLFPRSKLALFLHQQYKNGSPAREPKNPSKPSSSRFARIASSIKREPFIVFNRSWRKRQHLIRRTIFYALAGVRYACEIPRWRWLNRTSLGAASAPWVSDPLHTKKAS